jgi:hypothetical protein
VVNLNYQYAAQVYHVVIFLNVTAGGMFCRFYNLNPTFFIFVIFCVYFFFKSASLIYVIFSYIGCSNSVSVEVVVVAVPGRCIVGICFSQPHHHVSLLGDF